MFLFTAHRHARGFSFSKRHQILLLPRRSVNPLGSVENIVDIVDTDSAPIDSASFTVGTVIKNDQVQNLPLNGRHWASLMTLVPGAVNTGSGNQNSVRFNGRGRDENNFTLDGLDQTGVKDPQQEENLRLVVSTEAIAEFRINTAIYSADQGNGAGGQVNLVSRSGSNEFHGSVFHFLRNNKTDARLFTDNDAKEDPFQLNQFGFRLGGPLVKDRSFFFASYEGLRQRRGVTFINLVPSQSFRQSVLSGPNGAALKPILDVYPAGTTSVNATTDSLELLNKNSLDENSVNLRFDHRFNQNHSFFFRTNLDVAEATLSNREDSLNTRTFDFKPSNHLLQYTALLTANFVNETRFGVNRSPLERVDGNGVLVEGPRIDGFTRLRPPVPQVEKGTSYSLINHSSWVRGRHTLRFGMEARRIHVNVAPRNAARGAGLLQFDFWLAKTIPITERHKLDFRVDMFNLFNRSPYGQPDGLLGTVTYDSNGNPLLTPNPLFGTSTFPLSVDIGTGTNRSLQFSLRYNF